MRKSWISLVLIILFPTRIFAGVEFLSLLPNPSGDDTLGEYIEIRNTGCENVDISGYHLYDAANKTYVIPDTTGVASHENIRFLYANTKISLNNSGIESITLTDRSGALIDTESYSGTQKDDVVIYLPTIDENCATITPIENNIGTGTTGVMDTASGSSSSTTKMGNSSTGAQAENGIILMETGAISSGTGIIEDSTGTTNTGAIEGGTGATATGILFPEIFPTRQDPTNAIFSGGIWDCGDNQPCRINVTFDPIFTGGLSAKNYICEVITATGTLMTCNPNTIYFSTGSSFSFHLTSKVDPSQSRNMSWGVTFPKVDTATGATQSGSGDSATGATSSDIGNVTIGAMGSGITSTGVIFPEIIPVFQNYTNTTQSGDTLTCTTSPCRVNFTLDSIFTGSFLMKNYTCEIRYGVEIYESCNPPQLYPIGTGAIEITLTHKSSGQKEIKILPIIQNISVASSSNTPTAQNTNLPLVDNNPPIVIMEYDGKLKSYHELIADNEMNCYAFTCAINLTAEKSYDPEGGKVRFLWYYGPNDIKTTKDPGEVKYGIGDHEIWFRVIDSAGNYASLKFYIHVLGPKSEEEKVKVEKKSKVKIAEKLVSIQSSGGEKKKKKPKKVMFFDPPTVLIQESKFIETENGYLCHTTTKTCTLNLTLSGTQKGIIYTWNYGDGEVLISKNPKSRTFAPGIYTIGVTAGYDSSTTFWTRDIRVEVIKIQKTKKAKKIKVKKVSKPKSVIVIKKDIQKPPIVPPVSESTEDIPYTSLALLGGIIPMVLLRRFLTGII